MTLATNSKSGKTRFIDVIVDNSRLFLLPNLFLIFLAAWGASHLEFEADDRIFFDEQDPYLQAEESLESLYGHSDNIFFIIAPNDEQIFEAGNLAAIEALTEKGWQIPHSVRVDSITNFQHTSVEGDDIYVQDLVENATVLGEDELAKIEAVALREIGLVGRLVSALGHVAAVNVTLNFPKGDNTSAVAESVEYARRLRDQLEQANQGLNIYLAGLAVTQQTMTELAANDMISLVPIMFLIVLALLGLILRSASAVLATLTIILLSIAVGMGLAGWWGISLNNVNVSAPTIIMTLAVADCMHVFVTFLRKLATADKAKALKASLELNIYPICLTSVTTAFGFLSMNFGESPPFRELGTISAVGVIGALWATVFVLPGLIMILPFRAAPYQKSSEETLSLQKLGSWVIHHENSVFFTSILLIATAVSFLPSIELNDDPIGYFSEDVPLYKASKFMEDNLAGTQSIQFSLDSEHSDGITDPVYLNSVAKFVDWLREQPEVVNAESLTDTLKRLNQIIHGDDPTQYRLPETKPLAAQYLLLYELSLPFGLNINNQMSTDKASLKVSFTLQNQKSRGLINFEKRAREWLQDNAPSIASPGAGESLMFAHIGQRNIESMLLGALVAVLLISSSLILAFRSMKYGLVSFIPNIFPALVTLGIWGAMIGEVNMAASVVFCLTLGLVVDDTIHFLVKYRSAHESGKDVNASILYAYANSGAAILSTSIILASGFLVLVISDFSINSTAGLLVAITFIVAVALDMVFFPTVLMKMERWIK